MPTKLLYLAGALVSTIAAAPLGCGSLDGHTGTPGTLATVQGGLLDPSGYGVPHDNDVRVAVVWRNLGGSGYTVSEDLPVQPVFPSSFAVQLDGPPPAAALGVQPGLDVPIGVGVVVAYEDLNGNGKLDLVPSDAGAFIDRIAGANESLYLVYIDGPVSPQAAPNIVGTPTPGYNLLQTQSCQTSPSNGGGAGSSSGGESGSMAGTDAPAEAGVTTNDGGLPSCPAPPPEWMPMTAPYDLTVSSDPQVNQIMCQNSVPDPTSAVATASVAWDIGTMGTPPGGYPSPTDPALTCLGSTSYFYQHCVTQPLICGPSVTSCTGIGGVVLGSASPPPGWPCP
jgi:hypothetical protein